MTKRLVQKFKLNPIPEGFKKYGSLDVIYDPYNNTIVVSTFVDDSNDSDIDEEDNRRKENDKKLFK